MQLVHLVERGERAQMSKRRGDFVTLDELIDDIGVDAARFFMLQRSHDTTLDLDLDLAREQSQENPVYYVQYAHARIASILRNAGRSGWRARGRPTSRRGRAALEPAERALVKRLLELPDEVREAAERRAPHRLTAYAHEVASDFHAFYRDCRVVGAEPGMEDLRLSLCLATQRGSPACWTCSESRRRSGCSPSRPSTRLWKKFRPQPSSTFCASMLRRNSSPCRAAMPIPISSTPGDAVDHAHSARLTNPKARRRRA